MAVNAEHVSTWFAECRRVLEDVATEMRATGRGDTRFRRLIDSMPRALSAQQPDAVAGYYLASFKRPNYNGLITWWMPNNAGYTTDINQAGIYTELEHDYHDSEYTVPVPVAFIDSLRVRRCIDPGDSLNQCMWTAKTLRAALRPDAGEVK